MTPMTKQEQAPQLAGGTPVERPVGRLVPKRASACGLTECRGEPMCERCAFTAGVLLKPCPWCWTEGDALFDLWDRFDAGHIAHVHCTHCGADGPSVYSEQSADHAIRDARHRWNSRMVARPKTPNVRAKPGAVGDSA